MKDGERGEGRHTPTPWEPMGLMITWKDPSVGIIAKCAENASDGSTARGNADFIVKACNAYESNQATIRELVEALESIGENCKMTHARPCFICDVVKMAKEKSTNEGRG